MSTPIHIIPAHAPATTRSTRTFFISSIATICSLDPNDADYVDTDATTATAHDTAATEHRPLQIFRTADQSPVHSLAYHQHHLLVGTWANVSAHRIDDPATGLISVTASWELKLTSASRTTNEPGEVNALWLDTLRSQLYAGCGDNVLYAIDLTAGGRLIRDFVGHKDYIHSVTGNASTGRIFSAGEDGAVRFWDARDRRSAGSVEPFRQERLARPELGRWLGAVAVNDGDWLLCGGGPRLALWHLRSLECTTAYAAFGGGVHVAGFVDDVVLAGGDASASVHEYSLNGDLVAEVPVSGPSVYTAVWQTNGDRAGGDSEGSGGGAGSSASSAGFLVLGGASNQLDVCTNLKYRDLVLELYADERTEGK